MTAVRVTFRGTREQLTALLRQVPATLAGRLPDPTGTVQGLQLRVGMTALSLIRQAFVVKSRGGTDEAGLKWAPLAPSTIARRRLGPGDRKSTTLKARAPQLSEKERRAIARDARDREALLVARGVSPGRARGLGRAQAEAAGRARGLVTGKGAVLASRTVEILRDTGVLLASLGPGQVDNILKAVPGQAVVGSNLDRATWHHRGTPTIPARRLWPAPDRWPESWMRQIYGQLVQGIGRIVELASGRGGQLP